MKFIFPITLLFVMTCPSVADSANLSSSTTERIIDVNSVKNPPAEGEKETDPSVGQVPPIVPPLPNAPEAQQFPESITDHPAVITPPAIDPEITIPPPVTDAEMAVNPKNLPAHPEGDVPVFPR